MARTFWRRMALGAIALSAAACGDSSVGYPVRDPHWDDAAALLAGDRALWWAPRPT